MSYVKGTVTRGSLALIGDEKVKWAVGSSMEAEEREGDADGSESGSLNESPWLMTSLPITGGLSTGVVKSLDRRRLVSAPWNGSEVLESASRDFMRGSAEE